MPRDPLAPVFTALLLIADVNTILGAFLGPQWGIFTTGGAPLVVADSVISVDFRRESRISDYPVEQGGFQSYDKVAVPYDARVRLACSGKAMPETLFLSQIDAAQQALDLFLVTTPDAIYSNVNIIHYDYRRARDGGMGVLLVDVWLQQVRATVQTQFTNTKAPEGVADVSAGAVQPQQPTPAQAAAVQSTPGGSSGAAGGLT